MFLFGFEMPGIFGSGFTLPNVFLNLLLPSLNTDHLGSKGITEPRRESADG